jgi:hypothetical protein
MVAGEILFEKTYVDDMWITQLRRIFRGFLLEAGKMGTMCWSGQWLIEMDISCLLNDVGLNVEQLVLECRRFLPSLSLVLEPSRAELTNQMCG